MGQILCKQVQAQESLERVGVPLLCLPAGLSVAVAPPHAWDAAPLLAACFPVGTASPGILDVQKSLRGILLKTPLFI